MKICIIGAGVAGLTAAIRLATKGNEVTVFEASTGPGGKLKEKMIGEYRFDLGPSLFTMPQWIDQLFIDAKKNPRNYFNYKKLDSTTKYFYEDGTVFTSSSNIDELEAQLKSQNIDTTNLKKYLKKTSHIYRTTEHIFIKSSLHKLKSYCNWQTAKSIMQLPFIKSKVTMAGMNKAYFKDTRLQQYFNRMATYNGSDPYKAPGTLNLINHIEHIEGVYFPEGGMYSITMALYNLALDLGVKFEFNTPVTEIICTDGGQAAIGVSNIEGNHYFDKIVSNADVYHTYKKLLPNQKAPVKILNQEKSSSALIFYWGIKKNFEALGLHNIFFANDYKAEFEDIFNHKIPHNDPTIYVNISSKECPTDAPPQHENWFVMVNVPNNEGQDWEKLKKEIKVNIINKINRILKTNIEDLIAVEEVLNPITIEQNTSSYKGALYGNASNSAFAAFMRHANFSSKIENLYFCGGSVHPGGGIPLCINSGMIVGELVSD
jgi:phytoene desaturase